MTISLVEKCFLMLESVLRSTLVSCNNLVWAFIWKIVLSHIEAHCLYLSGLPSDVGGHLLRKSGKTLP